MSVLINGKKVAAQVLGLVLMSSVAGQAFAFACLDKQGKEAMASCANECHFDPNSINNPFSVIACF